MEYKNPKDDPGYESSTWKALKDILYIVIVAAVFIFFLRIL